VSLLQRADLNIQQGRMDIPRVQGSMAQTYPLQPETMCGACGRLAAPGVTPRPPCACPPVASPENAGPPGM
jgi:hypothetical protein